jgi:hypothetical protein
MRRLLSSNESPAGAFGLSKKFATPSRISQNLTKLDLSSRFEYIGIKKIEDCPPFSALLRRKSAHDFR